MKIQQRTEGKITITQKAVNSKEQETIRGMLKKSPEIHLTHKERECLEKIFK